MANAATTESKTVALTLTSRINEFAAQQIIQDSAFDYTPGSVEIANRFWTKGLTGEERVEMTAGKKGGCLAQLRSVVRDMAALIE